MDGWIRREQDKEQTMKKSKWRVIGEVGKVFDKDNDEIWNFFGEKE